MTTHLTPREAFQAKIRWHRNLDATQLQMTLDAESPVLVLPLAQDLGAIDSEDDPGHVGS